MVYTPSITFNKLIATISLGLLLQSPVFANFYSGHAAGIVANSGQDYVSPNEQYRGNGKKDAVFQALITAPNQTITGIEVRNTNGQYSVWDTHPNNRFWLGAVVVNGQVKNHSNGSIRFRLGSGKQLLKLYAEDNGSVRGGKTNFRMTVTFTNGKKLVIPLPR